MKSLALVVITKNAQSTLRQCLESVPFALDKVVVDSGSQDGTIEIAKSLGARVFEREWQGYGLQKKMATELSQCDWVLSLDSDEALSPELQSEIQAWLEKDEATSAPAYRFARLSFHMGRWIRHGGWYPDWQVRLFDRRRAAWSEDVIHEKVIADRVGQFSNPILHWVFRDLSHQVETNNRYSSLGALALAKKGRSFSLFHLLTKPWVKFFETYVWKRGFLDGRPGFIIAVGAAYSVFLKWAKLGENLARRDETPS